MTGSARSRLRPRPYRCPCGCKASAPGPHIWVVDGFHHDYPDALSALAAQANASPVRGYVRPIPAANVDGEPDDHTVNGLRVRRSGTRARWEIFSPGGDLVGVASTPTEVAAIVRRAAA